MKLNQIFFFVIIGILTHINYQLFAQISQGGVPPSFNQVLLSEDFQEINLAKPDMKSILEEDKLNEDKFHPYRIAVTIDVDININNSGTWTKLKEGGMIWRLKIKCKDALALGVYYEKFYLPKGSKLFLYNEDRTQVIGAFTSFNNSETGIFATELIKGDVVILEYFEPKKNKEKPLINISEIAYAYRSVNPVFVEKGKGFGDSGPCEVNINCPEGDNRQEQKRGVCRILLKDGASLSWCTGSLVNNVRQDFMPYFLTANHCGPYASTSDFNQWIFYFNYESVDCPNPQEEPPYNSMVGARLIAKTIYNISLGSDFKLLRLNNAVPDNYNPYFNGWNRVNTASSNGTGIHHPAGDIKKISTYNEQLVSTVYDGTTVVPDAMFWKVVWAATENGHGVTEGGSSGSPIFDSEGRIVGTLTGGKASCTNLYGPDYYGKFSYHWQLNGSTDSIRLQPWLDPDNTGILYLDGTGLDSNVLVAMFKADTTLILVGGSINFTDVSIGNPNEWLWNFEGGTPSYFYGQNPSNIKYDAFGNYDVSLIIKNETSSDTIVQEDYISVKPTVSPNPTKDFIEIFLGNTSNELIDISVFNNVGAMVADYKIEITSTSVKLNLVENSSGMYFINIRSENYNSTHKVSLIK